MADLRVTPAALRDLEGIWTYNAQQWGEAQAARYLDGLDDCYKAMPHRPFQPRPASTFAQAIGASALSAVPSTTGSKNPVVVVVRVLHERMDVLRHL